MSQSNLHERTADLGSKPQTELSTDKAMGCTVNNSVRVEEVMKIDFDYYVK